LGSAPAPEKVYAIITRIVDGVSHTRLTSNILVMLVLSGVAAFLNVAAYVPVQKPPALRRRGGQTQAHKDPLSSAGVRSPTIIATGALAWM
jgi:hypothetical protein